MAIKQLIHPANWKAPLTGNATINTFTISTDDAAIIEDIMEAYNGKVRMLIIKPPIASQPGTSYETVLVTGTNTLTGICYTNNMTNYSKYVVVSGAEVMFNISYDGNMEYYGTDGFLLPPGSSIESYNKSIDSLDGVQSLFAVNSGTENSYIYAPLSISANEDLYYGIATKVLSGTTPTIARSLYFSGLNTYDTYFVATNEWKHYDAAMHTISTTSEIWNVYWTAAGAKGYFDSSFIVNNLVINGTFMISGTNLITNGSMELDSDWGNYGTPVVNERSSAQAYSGVYSRHFIGDGSGDGINQTVALKYNTYYFYSSFMYTVSGTVRMATLKGGSPYTSYNTVTLTAPAGWTNKTYTFRKPDDGVQNTYFPFVQADATNVEAYIDTVYLYEITGWDTSNSTMELDNVYKKSAYYCAKVTATADNGYLFQSINTINNHWYTFKAYGRNVTAGHRFKFQIVGNQTYTIYGNSDWIDTTSYYPYSVTFKVVNDTSIMIKAIVETSGEIAYFDDFSLIPLITIDTTESSSTEENSYDYGAWSINNKGSIKIDSNDLFCVGIVSGTDLEPKTGSVHLRYRPLYDYDEFDSDAVLISGSNFFKLYYNHEDYKFYGEFWNGNEFVSSGCNSEAQTFVSGTWIFVGFSYDNDVGSSLYIDGEIVGEYLGTWDQQDVPTLVSIGSISGTDGGRARGFIDDICFYTQYLKIDDFYKIYYENHDND